MSNQNTNKKSKTPKFRIVQYISLTERYNVTLEHIMTRPQAELEAAIGLLMLGNEDIKMINRPVLSNNYSRRLLPVTRPNSNNNNDTSAEYVKKDENNQPQAGPSFTSTPKRNRFNPYQRPHLYNDLLNKRNKCEKSYENDGQENNQKTKNYIEKTKKLLSSCRNVLKKFLEENGFP